MIALAYVRHTKLCNTVARTNVLMSYIIKFDFLKFYLQTPTTSFEKLLCTEYTLDKNHAYFYQIQGTMMLTKRDKCILIIFTKKDCKYFLIREDAKFQREMLDKLTRFYREFFKPALLDKLLYRNTHDLAIDIVKQKINNM